MNILVGVKHVPDTETRVRIAADGRSIDEGGVKWVISPYDEYALEEALKLRDAAGEGQVLAACAARGAAQATLRQALAMGADRAVLIEDPRFERCDGLVRARALAAVARSEEVTLVLVGKYGVGTDEAQTGPMLAELLGWPHTSGISTLELAGDSFSAKREIEGGVEIVEGRLPAVLSCDKGLNEPRYATLKGIMQAKKKPLDIRRPADVGIADEALAEPMVTWTSLELPPERQAGRRIDGDAAAAAHELARLLREEAKVI